MYRCASHTSGSYLHAEFQGAMSSFPLVNSLNRLRAPFLNFPINVYRSRRRYTNKKILSAELILVDITARKLVTAEREIFTCIYKMYVNNI